MCLWVTVTISSLEKYCHPGCDFFTLNHKSMCYFCIVTLHVTIFDNKSLYHDLHISEFKLTLTTDL
jgi:hypothetical protein